MRSQRLALMLLLLLVLTFMVASALGARMTQLQRQINDITDQQRLLEEQQEQQRQDLLERERQLRDAKRDLSDTERSMRDLERQINSSGQLQQERDELKAQLEQERQRANQLQEQIENLESMNRINTQVLAERGLSAGRKLPRKILTRGAYRDYLNATLDQNFPPEEEHRERAKLLALDMIGPDINLRQEIIEGQVDAVLGFYEPQEELL
jgi:chromosome segregation ATPase